MILARRLRLQRFLELSSWDIQSVNFSLRNWDIFSTGPQIPPDVFQGIISLVDLIRNSPRWHLHAIVAWREGTDFQFSGLCSCFFAFCSGFGVPNSIYAFCLSSTHRTVYACHICGDTICGIITRSEIQGITWNIKYVCFEFIWCGASNFSRHLIWSGWSSGQHTLIIRSDKVSSQSSIYRFFSVALY